MAEPVLVRLLVPESWVAMVAPVVAVMVDVAPPARVSALDPESSQEEPLAPVSEKVRFPMLRALSRVTVVVAVMLLDKVAVDAEPSATVVPDHMAVLDQLFGPTETSVHVPSEASNGVTEAIAKADASKKGLRRSFIGRTEFCYRWRFGRLVNSRPPMCEKRMPLIHK